MFTKQAEDFEDEDPVDVIPDRKNASMDRPAISSKTRDELEVHVEVQRKPIVEQLPQQPPQEQLRPELFSKDAKKVPKIRLVG